MEGESEIVQVLIENPPNSEDEIDRSSPTTPRRLSREIERNPIPTGGSFVWHHFTKDTNYKENKKAACNHCNKTYICSGGSTSGLKKHLKNNHNIVEPNQNEQQSEPVNVFDMLRKAKVSILIYKFDFNKL